MIVGNMASLASDLARDFRLTPATLRPHPGGFESDCFVADQMWFVKVWHRNEGPADLGRLNALQAAGLPVPAPVRTLRGGLYAWSEGRPYAVFPFVRGRTAEDEDWRLTANALKRVHEVHGVDLPRSSMDEPDIRRLGERLDHPWIRARGHEVAANMVRLEQTIGRARAKAVRHVVCHQDFGGFNLLIDDGHVAAILDWDQAVCGPREHDLWVAAEGAQGELFLAEYGARDLDLDHLEYALLARALRDMAARVLTETDQPGVGTWGFQRIARLERDLEMFRPFCA
jgi:Ser/Thr protein kinase RdoA (MazF antagonist)